MTFEKKTSNKRSASLDLLRFLAVSIVFFAHYTDTFNYVYNIVPENLKWLNVSCYSALALLIFFIVSGYVVTMTSIERTVKDFIITRISRIYPLFWVSCLTAFILSRLVTHSYLPYISLKVFLVNLTMFPSFFGYTMVNPVFHTLVIEMIFYFFISIVIVLKLWKHILIIISLLLASCAYSVVKQNLFSSYTTLPFTAGMLFYFINSKRFTLWKLYLLLAINFCFALSGAKLLTDNLNNFYKSHSYANMWITIAIITVIYLTFLMISLNKLNIKSRKFYHKLGEIAYPFYLFHIYFLCIYWYFRDKIQADLLLVILFIVITITSIIINITVEKPISRLTNFILIFFLNSRRKTDV